MRGSKSAIGLLTQPLAIPYFDRSRLQGIAHGRGTDFKLKYENQ